MSGSTSPGVAGAYTKRPPSATQIIKSSAWALLIGSSGKSKTVLGALGVSVRPLCRRAPWPVSASTRSSARVAFCFAAKLGGPGTTFS